MTPSEAIQHIKRHIEVHRIKEPQAIYITEALKMAVEALDLVKDLKEWESRSKDIIELQDIEKESLMAENDRLKSLVLELLTCVSKWSAKHDDDLSDELHKIPVMDEYRNKLMEIKLEVVKECVGRLKEKAVQTYYGELLFTEDDFDNLLKEMG